MQVPNLTTKFLKAKGTFVNYDFSEMDKDTKTGSVSDIDLSLKNTIQSMTDNIKKERQALNKEKFSGLLDQDLGGKSKLMDNKSLKAELSEILKK